MSKISDWRPSWWSETDHGSAWERVKEALRRDWAQTKHDLNMGGHEMNQSVSDTLRQAAGKEGVPGYEEANPPKVIGAWGDAEALYRYGFAARSQYGRTYAEWSAELEEKLKSEWVVAHPEKTVDWESDRRFVRRGFELGPPPR